MQSRLSFQACWKLDLMSGQSSHYACSHNICDPLIEDLLIPECIWLLIELWQTKQFRSAKSNQIYYSSFAPRYTKHPFIHKFKSQFPFVQSWLTFTEIFHRCMSARLNADTSICLQANFLIRPYLKEGFKSLFAYYVVLRKYQWPTNSSSCRALYIPPSDRSNWEALTHEAVKVLRKLVESHGSQKKVLYLLSPIFSSGAQDLIDLIDKVSWAFWQHFPGYYYFCQTGLAIWWHS